MSKNRQLRKALEKHKLRFAQQRQQEAIAMERRIQLELGATIMKTAKKIDKEPEDLCTSERMTAALEAYLAEEEKKYEAEIQERAST